MFLTCLRGLYAATTVQPQALDGAGDIVTNATITHIYAMGQSIGYTRTTNSGITHYAGFLSAPLPSLGGMYLVPTNLTFVGTYNSTNPLSQTYAITNSGTLPFGYSNHISYIIGTPNWLSTTPQTGVVAELGSSIITARVVAAGLDSGFYTADNTIYSDRATNSPAVQTISLTINKADQTINFPALPEQETTNLIGLAATADSGLPVTFTVASGPAVITSQTNLSFTTNGMVVLLANQTGDSNWNAAPTATNSFNVTKAVASVTFSNLTQVYDGSAKTVTSLSNPTGLNVMVTYDGMPMAPVEAGSYAVTGTVNDTMYQGVGTNTLVIQKANATVNLQELIHTFDGSEKEATATTAPLGLTVEFTYDGETNLPVNAGSYAVTGTVIEANYQGNTNGILVIQKADQLISFPSVPEQETTNVTTLTASAASGLPISYEVISGPANISNQSNLTYTTDGAVIVRALQPGDTNWNPAPNVTNTFNVIKAVGSVILSDLTQVYNGSPLRPSSLSSPTGLAVNLTFDGVTNEPLNADSYQVIGTMDDPIYQSAATDTFTIVKATNVITFAPVADQTYTSLVELAATANSGLTVSFAVGSGPASITGNTNLSFTATGVVSIVASQSGNTNWLSAPEVTNTFIVNKADQIIDFTVIPDQETTNVTTLSATAISSLPVSFEVVSGEADLVDQSNLTYRTDGFVVVRALQGGDPYWHAAPNATNTFNVIKAVGTVVLSDLTQVYDGMPKYPTDQTDPSNLTVNLTFDGITNLPVNVGTYEVIGTMDDPIYQSASTDTFTIVRATQTISFVQIPDQIITNEFSLEATGGASTNPIIFTIASGPAVIAGNTNIYFNNVGQVIVTADQAGDSNYLSAVTSSNIFNVAPTRAVISTPTVSNILAQSASLGGTIDSTNGAPVTERGVRWRTEGMTNYYYDFESGAFGTGPFSLDVTGTVAGITNYFQAFADNVSGRVYTVENSFMARPDAPEALSASTLDTYAFQANWNPAIGATNYLLDVALDNSFSNFVTAYNNRIMGTAVTATVTGLTESTVYYYRLRAENAQGISTNSATISATTLTEGAIGIQPMALTFESTYDYVNPDDQTCQMTNFGQTAFSFTNAVTYSAHGTEWLTALPDSGSLPPYGTTTFTCAVDIAALNAGTYYATNAVVSPTATNSPQSVRITLVVTPATQTISFAQIPDMIITDTFELQATGGNSTNPIVFTVASGPAVIAGNTNLSFNNVGPAVITANQAGDSNYLAAVTFTNIFNVAPTTPVISTPTVSNILSQSASLGGTIDATNGAPVTERGVIWYVEGSTNIYSDSQSGAFGTSVFSLDVTGIVAGVTNYFQAFADNVSGRVYTVENSFLAHPDAPEATGPTNNQPTSFDANWNAAIGATDYYLDVSETNTFDSFIPGYNNLYIGNELSATVTGLGSVIWYYYRVRAENDAAISTNSATITAGLMLDLVINALPGEHDTPAPLDYGTHRILVDNIITNRVTSPTDESNGTRYVCTGWSGIGDVPSTGDATSVSFLFRQESVLTWHWKTQHLISQSAVNGQIMGLTTGWIDEGWTFDLLPRSDFEFVFSQWVIDGVPSGSADLLSITADAPHTISAEFSYNRWDINATGAITRTSWWLDPTSGTSFATFEVCNTNDSEKLFMDRFIYAMDPKPTMHLTHPQGTTPDGKEGMDITTEVQRKLLLIGNHDAIMDPGECINLDEIEFNGKDPAHLTSYFYSKCIVDTEDFDTDGDSIPNYWEDQEGLNMNNPLDGPRDQDDDGTPSDQEYIADTNPYDAQSYLHISDICTTDRIPQVIWVGGRSSVQYLEWMPSMGDTNWLIISTNLPPTPTTNIFIDGCQDIEGYYRIRAVR